MTEFKWIVLVGGFTGDGSSVHRLYRNETGDRVLAFNSQAAAEQHVLKNCVGSHALIAEVTAQACPAVALEYSDGRTIMSADCP